MSIIQEKDLRRHTTLEALTSQQLGDWWLDSQASAVLQVQSFVVPGEHNFLLNPAHAEFTRIEVEPPAIFHLMSASLKDPEVVPAAGHHQSEGSVRSPRT